MGRILAREVDSFEHRHPTSRAMYESSSALLGGVPMPWMTEWAGPYPIYFSKAQSACVIDVDGNSFVDLCLGDTGAMTGHSPAPVVKAVTDRVALGITTMLPTEDALWVSHELKARFGLAFWQFSLSASDANRFAIRIARAMTGRSKVLVFNGCYHGSVDEALVTLDNGCVVPRPGNVGPPVDPAATTRVVEFNDLEALDHQLAHHDVACVLAEPALTNIGIVLPESGFHDGLRSLTRKHGTLLIIDETHTISSGPGGYTAAFDLDPDMLTAGKPLAGGIPAACYGMSDDIGRWVIDSGLLRTSDTGGIGGTLAGNALSLAAMRATLEHVLTQSAYERMEELAKGWTEGVQEAISDYGMPWSVTRLGCRAEYWFAAVTPKNGGQAEMSIDARLSRLTHLYAMNRGLLLTPFHNMALMSPDTGPPDVARHTRVFREMVEEFTA